MKNLFIIFILSLPTVVMGQPVEITAPLSFTVYNMHRFTHVYMPILDRIETDDKEVVSMVVNQLINAYNHNIIDFEEDYFALGGSISEYQAHRTDTETLLSHLKKEHTLSKIEKLRLLWCYKNFVCLGMYSDAWFCTPKPTVSFSSAFFEDCFGKEEYYEIVNHHWLDLEYYQSVDDVLLPETSDAEPNANRPFLYKVNKGKIQQWVVQIENYINSIHNEKREREGRILMKILRSALQIDNILVVTSYE